jgi:ribose transport system substrate-binding protein
MRIHTLLAWSGAWILALALMSCTPPPEALQPAEPAAPEATPEESVPRGPWTIGMSQCNLGEPWRVQMNADVKAAADAYPEINVLFKDAQNDTLVQVSHLQEFASQGVDAIIISPKEEAPFVGPITQATQAGIPVIILDRAVPNAEFAVFIGADNVQIGKAAGAWAREYLGGEGKMVELMGLMTTVPGHDRHRGFEEGIAGSEIEVIFQADMQWLQDIAQKEMESALARFDDIDLVYAHNDPGAYGAYLAAKSVGREGEIAFVGIDALPQEGVAYVKEGILDATFEYPTGGKEGVEMALKIMRGEEVPKHITLSSRVFTKDNVDAGGKILE